MNCREFETVVHDLAGTNDRLSPCQSGLAHAQVCARCSALLLEALSLRADLRSLAASYSRKQAAARVEETLRHAFQHSRIRGERSRGLRQVIAFGAAVAAAAVVLLALVMGGLHRRGTSMAVNPPTEAPATMTSRAAGPSTQATPGTQAPSDENANQPARIRKQVPSAPSELEWATDFLPLADADDPALLDSAPVVRVILPRSELASWGLPFSADQSDGSVLADLVVDEAGTPRAIRLVR